MQLMPDTASPVARQRGLPFDDGALLDEPSANLTLGSAYLAGLLKEFGDPRLAVAAYNAGRRRPCASGGRRGPRTISRSGSS